MHTRRAATEQPKDLEPVPDVRRTGIRSTASATRPSGAPTAGFARSLQQRAQAPAIPAPAAEGFRLQPPNPGETLAASPSPVFRTQREAETLASKPGERAVRIRSPEARRRARRLAQASRGKSLDTDVAAGLRKRLGDIVDRVTVHEDERAGLAAQLLGAHAFSLGHRIFLGTTLGTAGGPSCRDALRHELVHIAQGEVGAPTGRYATHDALEDQARDGTRGRDLEQEMLGADPAEIHEWLWIPALIVGAYILLDPDPANAPTSRRAKTYSRKPTGQRVGEAVSLALPMGMLGKTPTLLRAAAAGATSQVGYTASGDIAQGRYSGTDVYAGRAATGAVLWMVPVPAARQYAAGAVGPRLWGTFAGSGAAGGITLRAMGDIGQGQLSPFEDYLLWGGAGAGLGLAGAGGVRGLDYLGTRGVVNAGQASADAAGWSTAPWWRRASRAYLSSRGRIIVQQDPAGLGVPAQCGQPYTVVEIGAGDLGASIELARKGGIRVIAVDPAKPAAAAQTELRALGGQYIEGTADALSSGSAHHVYQYFPYEIEGTGRLISANTWRLADDTIRLLKPSGAAHFVTHTEKTALFLAGQASSRGMRVVITETTAGAAAPGASGAGVPDFGPASRVWLVNIYK